MKRNESEMNDGDEAARDVSRKIWIPSGDAELKVCVFADATCGMSIFSIWDDEGGGANGRTIQTDIFVDAFFLSLRFGFFIIIF